MSLYTEYKKSLKMLEVEEVLDLIIFRPPAFLLVKLIYQTSITPNQITWVSLFFGVFGAFLITFGTATAFTLAAICFIIYNILDCSDGQLARLQNSGTLTGRIVDGFADYIVAVTSYLAIGVGYASNTNDPFFYWTLTALAGFSNALHSFALDYYRNQFLDYALDRKSILGEDLEQFETEYNRLITAKKWSLDRLLIWIYLKYSRIQISLSSKQDQSQTRIYNPKDYYNKNKRMIHLWTYIGPTTELTFMIVCAFINRWDIFLWGMVTIGNIYTLILYIIQKSVIASLKKVEP
ncbi:MAG: CDP-alcohol phosphatidyltransferase family protein [Calditrichia bacterium]|nr:CDP-alcohol phosphatidyltransferase family protein [Calditrichia bacterium]